MDTKYKIKVSGDRINIIYDDGKRQEFGRETFPELFLNWQSQARVRMFSMIQSMGSGSAKTMPVHLPVLGTVGEGDFPVNLATRGMGVLPKASILEETITAFNAVKERSKGMTTENSLAERIEVVKMFYSDINNFDGSLLGGLEIFEGQTYKNVSANPLASLLYTGEAPKFPSYQFNGVIELVENEDPYYRYLLAARELFANDSFHVHQEHYPFGYLFHLVGQRDKTPFSVKK